VKTHSELICKKSIETEQIRFVFCVLHHSKHENIANRRSYVFLNQSNKKLFEAVLATA